jgi:type I restriction enzyme S subunit
MVVDKQNKVLNFPTLRFPEFTVEWELHPTTDFFEFKNGLNPDPKRFGSGTKFISVMDILNNRYITYDKIIAFVEPKGNDLKEFGVNYGDVLFQRSSETLEDVGRANVYLDKETALFGGFVIRGKKIGEYNPLFFRYLLSSPHVRKRIVVKGAGAQHFNIGQDGLSKVYIFVPTTKEQERIARLLDLLDERIEAQIRIIDKFKSLMQGLNNELMDNPKWAKVYIGDFMEFYSTNSLSWEQLNYNDGQLRNLHYGLIHSGLPTLVDCHKISLPYIQDTSLPKQYVICKDGDVAFADASEDTEEVGKAVELTNIGTQTIACGLHTIHGRDVKNIMVGGFKGFAFNSKYFHDQLRRIAQGSKVYSINTDNVKSCYIYIPTIDEQQKIVGLLCCMQDKIEIAEKERHLYESQKQFLLRGLFV